MARQTCEAWSIDAQSSSGSQAGTTEHREPARELPAVGAPEAPERLRQSGEISQPAEAPAAADADKRTDSPRATRVREGAWLGGVCTGLARHLGWPVIALRLAFVALGPLQFVGVLVYGVLWLVLPPEPQPAEAPGLEAAQRTGMRQKGRRHTIGADVGAALALGAFGAGMLWLVQSNGWGLQQQIFWPALFACTGAALFWRQVDTMRQDEAPAGTPWTQRLVRSGSWFGIAQLVVGALLVALAVAMVVLSRSTALPEVLAMVGVGLMAAALIIAPFAYRARNALNVAREEKIRADARADMAAHLHDSVLQTLALIQRQAQDPKAVHALARRQERELRAWLYGEQREAGTLKTALEEMAAQVESERNVEVELVTVGDCDLDDDLLALVNATGEALTNAAKHSGADTVDVYAEVEEGRVEVFVRDRGAGFDLDTIAEDRLGVRRSIIDRMERHGGRAVLRSAPGEGTEVRLEMNR